MPTTESDNSPRVPAQRRRRRGATRGPSGPAGRAPAARGPAGRRREPVRPGPPQDEWARRLLAALTGHRTPQDLWGLATGTALHHLTTAAPPYRTATPVLRTTRATQVGPGVLEASATLEADGRVHAIAFRLEDRGDGVWRCTALELAP
ncbi:Rv3235 family protein [Streptomyces sp. NPDC004959]|uniref:Rv3235 family protein n=2 Tax=unclassified Streptomyces TaxID=2593676 RepID=UPI0033B131FB